jgi:hypothetical protein
VPDQVEIEHARQAVQRLLKNDENVNASREL